MYRLSKAFFMFALFAGCGPSPDSSRLKEDIFPVGGFGKLLVRGPSVPAELSGKFRLQVSRKNGVPGPTLTLDSAVSLESFADYCLSISSYGSEFTSTMCGIAVQANQTTTIQSTLLSLDWNVEGATRVEVGPKPLFILEGTKQSITVAKPSLEAQDAANRPFLVVTDWITARYLNVGALAEDRAVISLPAETEARFDITPPDRRSSINLSIPLPAYSLPRVDADGKFFAGTPLLASFATLAHVEKGHYGFPESYAQLDGYYYGTQSASFGYYSWKGVPVYRKDRPTRLTYRAFPLVSGLDKGEYELQVSGVRKVLPLTVDGPRTLELSIEPLNVGHINGVTPGFYKVTQQPEADGFSPALLGWRNLPNGNLTSDTGTPTLERLGNFMPTETTFFVLRGYAYQLDSYMYDDSKILVKQSGHFLDYK